MNEENKKIKGYTGSAPVAGVGGAQVQGLGITQNGVTPITPESLAPQAPLKVQPAPTTSVAYNLSSMATGVKDAAIEQKQADQKVAESQKDVTDGKALISDLYTQLTDVQGSRPGLEAQAGIDTKTQRVTDYTNKLEASERAQQNEIRALEQGAGTGMTTQGKADAIQAINRRYAFEQADLAILQSAANRDLATAQSIIDRKIELQLEPLKTKMDAAKFFYEENKESFTKEEERQYKAMLTKQERLYTETREEKKKIEDLRIKILENGGSEALAQRVANADNYSEALSVAGNYAGDQLGAEIKRMQIEEMKAAIEEKKQKVAANSPEAKALETKASSLNNLNLVNEVIDSPYLDQVVGLKNPFTYWTPGSNEQYVKNQFNQLKSTLSLENRQLLKGSGAVSDFEFKVLGQASSALGKNLSNEANRKELRKIKGVFQTASGLPATVKVVDPVTKESQTLEATREQINAAVADGLLVEYQ